MTKVYGHSDDIIEIEGEGMTGEVGCYGTDDQERGVLLIMSDGTMLEAKYGKHDRGIWEVKLVRKGEFFDRIDQCDDEDANPYSDVAWFKPGIRWAYAAKEWEPVR